MHMHKAGARLPVAETTEDDSVFRQPTMSRGSVEYTWPTTAIIGRTLPASNAWVLPTSVAIGMATSPGNKLG
jgi:hypothetical protein